MKAVFPNGLSFDITEEQARKIKFIQECIRKQRSSSVNESLRVEDRLPVQLKLKFESNEQ